MLPATKNSRQHQRKMKGRRKGGFRERREARKNGTQKEDNEESLKEEYAQTVPASFAMPKLSQLPFIYIMIRI